jgi:hypothetical protein
MKASQVFLTNDTSFYLSVVVEIKNRGRETVRLKFGRDRKPLWAYVVRTGQDGSLAYEEGTGYSVPVSTSPNEKTPSYIVRAGASEKIPFLCRLISPGLYLLVFTAEPSDKEQEILKKHGFVSRGNWTAKEYCVVGSPPQS